MAVSAFPWPVASGTRSRVRHWRARLRLAQLLADVLAVSASVTVAAQALFRQTPTAAEAMPYLAIAPVLAAAWVAALDWTESRSYRVAGTGSAEYGRVIAASLGVFLLLAVTGAGLRVQLPVALFTITLPLGVVFLLGARLIVRQHLTRLRAQGEAMTPALLIGGATHLRGLLDQLDRRTEVGYLATGVCLLGAGCIDGGDRRLDYCNLDQVPDLVESGRYGSVIVSGGLTRDQLRELARRVDGSAAEVLFQPRLADLSGSLLGPDEEAGLALLPVQSGRGR
ncbi:hypothetical protein ATK74_0155 [Propionicimonas paludicola]|uniref:Sugar transferase n=1 Tax=Propionicimonas paludicola TaxID=185243 RepID=A0A2A9CNH2_9ACTN|nr:hypothetical protein ATK74_0155 [Propionicimonas paludicola]